MAIELTKLKPFNPVEAKQGKPICTRNRKKARIICQDLKGNYSIAAAVENSDGSEEISKYTKEGYYYHSETKHINDLMMLSEKKEGFINIYQSSIYTTKEEALKHRSETAPWIEVGDEYIDTIKITWYE